MASYEAAAQIEDAVALLDAAPYVFVFENENDTWELSANTLAQMILPGEDVMPVIDKGLFVTWFEEEIAADINQESTDARLNIADGRVTDFVASQEGRAVNQEDALTQFYARIAELDNSHVLLLVETEEPSVTTADVNDLGITEILGVGTSSYAGSPSNRRDNIQNGVDLLNGRLIAPNETFSLIEALAPFTYDNGYLPELVIKGDKIEPEMGGGLCQIGSTTFRATMNVGLAVTERRNHSLVVSYYNDQTNGLPGTDATIYEPAPDYKFTNDTEHYVLFQAENLTSTQELKFTFWGTSDGRQGSYEPPTVHRWIPVGPTQYIETLDLNPGVEECQYEHIGADTSFAYTVV
ncbi:MAG: VanW family protein, partial [Alphaproteobacteria bacterium]|nr:VanW family protein [Alphaproteobacteria bacterium]